MSQRTVHHGNLEITVSEAGRDRFWVDIVGPGGEKATTTLVAREEARRIGMVEYQRLAWVALMLLERAKADPAIYLSFYREEHLAEHEAFTVAARRFDLREIRLARESADEWVQEEWRTLQRLHRMPVGPKEWVPPGAYKPWRKITRV